MFCIPAASSKSSDYIVPCGYIQVFTIDKKALARGNINQIFDNMVKLLHASLIFDAGVVRVAFKERSCQLACASSGCSYCQVPDCRIYIEKKKGGSVLCSGSIAKVFQLLPLSCEGQQSTAAEEKCREIIIMREELVLHCREYILNLINKVLFLSKCNCAHLWRSQSPTNQAFVRNQSYESLLSCCLLNIFQLRPK